MDLESEIGLGPIVRARGMAMVMVMAMVRVRVRVRVRFRPASSPGEPPHLAAARLR